VHCIDIQVNLLSVLNYIGFIISVIPIQIISMNRITGSSLVTMHRFQNFKFFDILTVNTQLNKTKRTKVIFVGGVFSAKNKLVKVA